MKNKKQVKMMLLEVFYGAVFVAQMIVWTLINYLRDYEKSMWFVIGIAVLTTVIMCSMYLFLRKLYQRTRRDEETTIVEDIYEIFGTDR